MPSDHRASEGPSGQRPTYPGDPAQDEVYTGRLEQQRDARRHPPSDAGERALQAASRGGEALRTVKSVDYLRTF